MEQPLSQVGDVPLGRYICLVLDLALYLLKLINMQTEIFVAIMFLLKKNQIAHDIIQKLTLSKHRIIRKYPQNHGIFQKQPPITMAFFKNTPSNHYMIQKLPLATITLFKNAPSKDGVQKYSLATITSFKNSPWLPWHY